MLTTSREIEPSSFSLIGSSVVESRSLNIDSTVPWYTDLWSSKLVQRCHFRRDVREHGSLQEGVKKHSLGKELLLSTGKADLRFK